MSKGKVPEGYLFTRGYTNYIFLLLFLLYMFDYTDRMIVTSMFTSIEKDWGITHMQSGALISAIYWSIIVLTFPVSILIDRWSRSKTIGLMAVVWSIATALCALTGNFSQLMFTRVLIGIGEAGYAPGGTAMIAALYPQDRRAKMMGVWNASIPLGNAIGVALGGIIAATWGWRHAFGLVALPGFVIAVLFFFIKDYKTVALVQVNQTQEKVKMRFRDMLNEFFDKPSLIFTYFGIASVAFVTTAVITFLSKYFQELYGYSQKVAGFKAAVVMLLALVGAPLGGYLADRWRKHRINARLLFPTITTLLSSTLLFLAFYVFRGLVQYILLLGFGVLVTAFISAASAVTQDVVHAGLRAVSYAIAVVIQNLLGASSAPLVIGWLYDGIGIEKAMTILPYILLVGSTLFFAGSRYYEKDLGKVTAVAVEAES